MTRAMGPGFVAASRRAAPLRERVHENEEDSTVNVTLGLAPLAALIAGILILLIPRLLNYIVAIYLILIGVLGLLHGGHLRF